MQTSVPELADISNEPKHILDMYGPDVHKPGTYAALLPACPPPGRAATCGSCRFFHRGWDQHGNMAGDLPPSLPRTFDQATLYTGRAPRSSAISWMTRW